MTSHTQSWAGICADCGKRCYPDKKSAKKHARDIRGRGRLHPYKCGDFWHIGHLPSRVIAGDKTRNEITNDRRTTP